MNTEMILRYLEPYNARELVYRDAPNAGTRAAFPSLSEAGEIPRQERLFFDNGQEHHVLLEKCDRFVPPQFHTHTFFELLYVLRGRCLHRLTNREETLGEGDFCLLSPSMVHAVAPEGDSLVLGILIRPDHIENFLFNVLRERSQISDFFMNSLYGRDYASYLTFHTSGDHEIRSQVLQMYLEQQFHGDAYSDRIISSMLEILLNLLSRGYRRTADIPAETEPKAEAAQFLYYILRDYRTITLASLAQSLNYSVPYCSRHIKEVTGCTFLQLLQKTRFQKAETYLLTSTMSIQKISALLGYENPENFIRAFKKAYGVSPARFRAQH